MTWTLYLEQHSHAASSVLRGSGGHDVSSVPVGSSGHDFSFTRQWRHLCTFISNHAASSVLRGSSGHDVSSVPLGSSSHDFCFFTRQWLHLCTFISSHDVSSVPGAAVMPPALYLEAPRRSWRQLCTCGQQQPARPGEGGRSAAWWTGLTSSPSSHLRKGVCAVVLNKTKDGICKLLRSPGIDS